MEEQKTLHSGTITLILDIGDAYKCHREIKNILEDRWKKDQCPSLCKLMEDIRKKMECY